VPNFGRHAEKFREVIPIDPKVITAHTLNFKPIFEFLLLKIVGAVDGCVDVSDRLNSTQTSNLHNDTRCLYET